MATVGFKGLDVLSRVVFSTEKLRWSVYWSQFALPHVSL